jgi:hypothetical protein
MKPQGEGLCKSGSDWQVALQMICTFYFQETISTLRSLVCTHVGECYKERALISWDRPEENGRQLRQCLGRRERRSKNDRQGDSTLSALPLVLQLEDEPIYHDAGLAMKLRRQVNSTEQDVRVSTARLSWHYLCCCRQH